MKNLNISRTYVKSLPDNIGELTNLEKLNLFDSKIAEYKDLNPMALAKLKNLKELGL